MREEGVIYVARHPLLNGDLQDSQGVSASEMTYIVSGRALNSTHCPPMDDRYSDMRVHYAEAHCIAYFLIQYIGHSRCSVG